MLPEDKINERFKEYKSIRLSRNVPLDDEAVALKFFLFQELALVNASFERVSSRLDSLVNKLEDLSTVYKVIPSSIIVADSSIDAVLAEEKARILPDQYGPNGEIWDTSPKTVIAWLEQADLFGCSWAQSAIEQADVSDTVLEDGLSFAVSNFAGWDTTKEGILFWEYIYDTLLNNYL